MSKTYDTHIHTGVENPKDGSFGVDIFIIPNKIDFLPDITYKAINFSLTEIIGTVEPIGSENTHIDMGSAALFSGVESVEERGAVVPFQVV